MSDYSSLLFGSGSYWRKKPLFFFNPTAPINSLFIAFSSLFGILVLSDVFVLFVSGEALTELVLVQRPISVLLPAILGGVSVWLMEQHRYRNNWYQNPKGEV